MSFTDRMTENVCKEIRNLIKNNNIFKKDQIDKILKNIQEKNNFNDEDMETYRVWSECQNMNEYEEGFLKGYNCPKCNNRGFMNTFTRYKGSLYYPVAVDCECKRIRAVYSQLEECGIASKQIKKYTLDNYTTEELWQNKTKVTALKYIKQFMENKESNDWFTITGVSGSGKSHICTSMFIELLKIGIKGKYMLWKENGERLLKLKKSFDPFAFEKELKSYKTAELLYIDDLFKLLPSDGNDRTHLIGIAFSIIDARYSNGLPTIISTEESLDMLRLIDSAVAGRIQEMSGEYLLHMSYSSTRDQRRK